jgi:hypothetical protein
MRGAIGTLIAINTIVVARNSRLDIVRPFTRILKEVVERVFFYPLPFNACIIRLSQIGHRANANLMGHRLSMLDPLFPPSFVARFAKSGSVAVAALGLIAAGAVAAPADNQDEKPAAALVERGIPLTAQARSDILQRVLAHPGVAQAVPGHRLAGIRVTAGSTTNPSGETKTIVTVVLFDHTALEARRVVIDAISNELLANDLLPGRPQSSREEVQEAVEIVRRDPDLARLLDQGGVLDGGFIVDDPVGSRRRMIQLKLLTTDRQTLLRSITVDLTLRVIASL